MDLVPIRTACPACGSGDVVYTCTPNCCFNHVCGACRTSWQLRTRPSEAIAAVADGAGREDYDTSSPSAPCSRCGGLVWQLSGRDELWCPACRIVLELVADTK